jgi:hypothetical protein
MLNGSNNNPMIVVNGHAASSMADIHRTFRYLGIETELSVRNAEVGVRLNLPTDWGDELDLQA